MYRRCRSLAIAGLALAVVAASSPMLALAQSDEPALPETQQPAVEPPYADPPLPAAAGGELPPLPPAEAPPEPPIIPVLLGWGVVPWAVAIPRLGVEAPVVSLGLDEDGAMAAPTDPDTVGWYELGPGIGAPGNAVLAGHVDWSGRLRAFGRLKTLAPGDQVMVAAGPDSWLSYRVSWTWVVEAEGAPVEEIFAQGVDEELTLITCGGTFDPVTRQYLSRVVVRAVREPPPPTEPATAEPLTEPEPLAPVQPAEAAVALPY